MPIRPEPQTFYCPKCGWQKTTAPRSDVLMPGDIYAQCPKCGNPEIEIRMGGLLTKMMSVFEKKD